MLGLQYRDAVGRCYDSPPLPLQSPAAAAIAGRRYELPRRRRPLLIRSVALDHTHHGKYACLFSAEGGDFRQDAGRVEAICSVMNFAKLRHRYRS